MQVDVGRRLDNLYSAPPPTAQLFAGSTLIASATGAEPLPGGWTTWTGTYQSSASDPLAGQALRIVLGATAQQGDFDNVRLTTVPAGGAPTVNAGGILNGASVSRTQAPAAGSIVSLFGTGLATQTLLAADVPLRTTLGGVSVLVNGVAAPLFFVSAGQINFQIPWEVASQAQVSVAVKFNNVTGTAVTLALGSAGPGIFTINWSGTGQGAIQIANTTIFAAPTGSIQGATARPAKRGDFLTFYCTGLGAVRNPPASGAIGSGQTTLAVPTMTIGGLLTHKCHPV